MGDETIATKLQALSLKHFGITPRACQNQAADLLQRRVIIEMETGEGKTLTVAMAAIAMAIKGKRVFVATANDYLAMRDAVAMRPMFEGCGLRVDALSSGIDQTLRRQIYACDVVYGTIRELGFDTLRDELADRVREKSSAPLMPKFHSLIIDEADSVLIDEALTPLVIHGHGHEISPEKASLYEWSAVQANRFRPDNDYVVHPLSHAIALTEEGITKAIHASMPISMNGFRMADILNSLENAIDVATRCLRDVHYLVKDSQVMLVDEHSGRIADAKKLSGGLHQAIEAKERLPLTRSGKTIARMTIQELVNRTPHLSGVTATAYEERRELGQVYGLAVNRLSPHVPTRRSLLSTKVFAHHHEKLLGILSETRELVDANRAVLIGTKTIEQSEILSDMMHEQRLSHVVLNARQSSEEASIIALAGQSKRVTVATNMAGRGTDIRIAQDVRVAGGLHVIVSEPHLTSRIDRQLAGRCGRQGDPGTVRYYYSPDDKILAGSFGDNQTNPLRRVLSDASLVREVKRAQDAIARRQREQRFQLAMIESQVVDDLGELGLNPHLDRLTIDD